VLAEHGIPLLIGVTPGKHPTRNGWILRNFHFPRDPFTGDIDAPSWQTSGGTMKSLRQIAYETVMVFRDAIRRVSGPFSYRLLLSVMRGETPSLLDLDDRPAVYDDVGRSTRWGSVLPELENFSALMHDDDNATSTPRRRRTDIDEKLAPPWSGELAERRGRTRRSGERRQLPQLAPSPRLTRSAYEKVFLKLGDGRQLRIDNEILTPVKVKGWYHSVFRDRKGDERLLSIDQLLKYMGSWE